MSASHQDNTSYKITLCTETPTLTQQRMHRVELSAQHKEARGTTTHECLYIMSDNFLNYFPLRNTQNTPGSEM